MLENRPEDALGTLVKLVRCCKIRRIARTVQNISHFEIVRYLNKTFKIVQTVQNISHFTIVRYFNEIFRIVRPD